MGARHKLNEVHILGSVLFAAVIGVICQSVAVFLGAACILVAVNCCAGNIRTRPTR